MGTFSVGASNRLRLLASITNATSFRSTQSTLRDGGNICPEQQAERDEALRELMRLATSGGDIRFSNLKFMKKLGEGAFASVELHELSMVTASTDAALRPDTAGTPAPEKKGDPVLVAVKIMKTQIPGPLNEMTGVIQMVAVPDNWR